MTAREDNERRKTETGEMRHKAYSLVFNEYDEIRRIVLFLRWHEDDAEDFAPSLFTGRGSGNRRTRNGPTEDNATEDQGTSVGQAAPASGKPVTPAGGTVSVAAGGFAPVVSGQRVSPFASEPAVPVGHEGGNPFSG